MRAVMRRPAVLATAMLAAAGGMVGMTGTTANAASTAAAAWSCPSTTGPARYTALCLYWGANGTGAYWAGGEIDNNLADNRYPNNGTGGGQVVKNNAASARNVYGVPIYIYYNENRTGPMDTVQANTHRQLVNTWNNEASYVIWCYFCN
jgi:hypothetical protein